MVKLAPILVLMLWLQGCPDTGKQGVTSPVVTKAAYQRFVVPSDKAIAPTWALDSKTGQICRTWDWGYKGKVSESFSGRSKQRR